MLERLIADGLAGRFPAEEVDILNWKEMLKRAQDLQLKLRKRLNQRAARSSAAPARNPFGSRPYRLKLLDEPKKLVGVEW